MTEKEEDKLIALSDLNRKDNIKYISSEAQGIAITLDSDRYAPTFCKLERAYICGRRKSEEQIAELEAQIEKMKCCGNCVKRGHICVAEEMQGKLCGKNKDKWELKEIKEK